MEEESKRPRVMYVYRNHGGSLQERGWAYGLILYRRDVRLQSWLEGICDHLRNGG